MYRITKQFEFQAAHVLSHHPGRCKFPHGHNYKVEITLSASKLDNNGMVCDFNALKSLVQDYLDSFDHCIMLNSDDKENRIRFADNSRTIVFASKDPTSEILAEEIFNHIKNNLCEKTIKTPSGVEYSVSSYVRLEKVRVWETSTAWAEYYEKE
jgi:6-pyruvoyltetrahydropterin/6-carboxytetrahydropterin synthase